MWFSSRVLRSVFLCIFFLSSLAACSGGGTMGTQTGERSIEGIVLDTSNNPIVGIEVQVRAPDTGNVIATVVTNSDGYFSLAASSDELPDSATLEFAQAGGKTGSASIEFGAAQDLQVSAIIQEEVDHLEVSIIVSAPTPSATPTANETSNKPTHSGQAAQPNQPASGYSPSTPLNPSPTIAVTETPTPRPIIQEAPVSDDNEEGKKQGDPNDPPPGESPMAIIPPLE